jgi:hypothetical protein
MTNNLSNVFNLLREKLVQLLLRVQHVAIALCALFDLILQCVVVVALKQSGHFAVGQQRVQALQKAGFHHVRLVHDEADLLVPAAGPAQNMPNVLVKVGALVLGMDFQLKNIVVFN